MAAARNLGRRRIAHSILEKSDHITRHTAKGSRGGAAPAFDTVRYTEGNVVERCFNRLKQFRALTTRSAKQAAYYSASVVLAATVLRLHT